MSFANEIRFKHYMVEFDSGRTAHIGGEDVEEVKEYCAKQYAGDVIKAIYLEVYYKEYEECQ
jgi:hypothetical protein